MSKNFREMLDEWLQDPEFKKEWDALQPEFQLIYALLDARQKNHMTKKELAEITGISLAYISRIENGNANPSLETIKRLASGLNMTVKIEFVPLK